MKKFDDKSNIVGNLIEQSRIRKAWSKANLSRKLSLLGVNLDSTELKRIESGKMIVKDFELIALCIALDIDYIELKNTLLLKTSY